MPGFRQKVTSSGLGLWGISRAMPQATGPCLTKMVASLKKYHFIKIKTGPSVDLEC